MPIIKRYPNRKLYDTEAKQYITLDGIAELIRRGEDVQVIDYSSGEDLTTLTLTQIILEEEKRAAGFLPRKVLSNLVRSGGERMSAVQRALAGPIGWINQVDEEIHRRLDVMVNKGDLSHDEARGLMSKLASAGAEFGEEAMREGKRTIESLLRQRGVPNREELDVLNRQLDELESKILEWEQRKTTVESAPFAEAPEPVKESKPQSTRKKLSPKAEKNTPAAKRTTTAKKPAKTGEPTPLKPDIRPSTKQKDASTTE